MVEMFDSPYPLRRLTKWDDPADLDEVDVYRWAATTRSGELRITFEKLALDGWEVDFTVDGSYELTGVGEGSRILATVLRAAKEFLESTERMRVKPRKMILTITKDGGGNGGPGSRERVYERLIQGWGRQQGWAMERKQDWRPFGSGGASMVVWTLERKGER
jgi:hypothetical protein